MRARELCRRAELTLVLSPALGAQPYFTTELRSAHAPGIALNPRSAVMTRERQNCDAIISRVYLQQETTAGVIASLSAGYSVFRGTRASQWELLSDFSFSKMTRATQTSTQMTAAWIFPLPTKRHASLPRYLFAPFGLDACTTNRWQTPPCAGRVKGKT